MTSPVVKILILPYLLVKATAPVLFPDPRLPHNSANKNYHQEVFLGPVLSLPSDQAVLLGNMSWCHGLVSVGCSVPNGKKQVAFAGFRLSQEAQRILGV